MRMQQGMQIKESSPRETAPEKWKQPEGEDRKEMKKDARELRSTLLNGSAWSTKKKYMRRNNGKV